MLDSYGIIRGIGERLQRPPIDTGNLFRAGCGNVIVSHLAPLASEYGGSPMGTFCPQCGKAFHKANRSQQWCSRQCSTAAHFIPIEDRFWAKVHKTDTCWLWTASLRNKGYGAFTYEVNGKPVQDRAHRYSYQLHVGDIPPGLFVLHRCDTPACVNPDHLFLGTNQDNVDDMIAKGRAGVSGSKCGIENAKWKRGATHHAARFTEDQIRAIRARYAAGDISYSQLGKLYDAGPGTMAKIVLRLRWKHVQ